MGKREKSLKWNEKNGSESMNTEQGAYYVYNVLPNLNYITILQYKTTFILNCEGKSEIKRTHLELFFYDCILLFLYDMTTRRTTTTIIPKKQ